MPTDALPLTTPVYKNVDGVELSDKAALLVDGYLDEEGASRGRPGLAELIDLGLSRGLGVDGMYWWGIRSALMVASGGKLLAVTRAGTSYSYSDLTTDGLQSRTRVVFAEMAFYASNNLQHYLFAANGGRIIYTDYNSNTAYLADGNTPTQVTHVACLDNYLIANAVGTNRWYWADINNPTVWNALNFATAAGDPDFVTAIYVYNREIYLFGSNSIEIWENDGATPFSRVPGGFIQSGCGAPYSVISIENEIIWIDSNRRVVTFGGNGVKEISSAYDKEIQAFPDISDAWSERVEIEGQSFILFHFPSGGKTLCWNRKNNTWSEWGTYDSASMSHRRFVGNGYAYSPLWNKHIVGSYSAPVLYLMSHDYKDDAGATLRRLRRTGHIDRGTLRKKRCKEVRFRVKRGVGIPSGTPKLMIRYRDDNKNTWSPLRELSLGKLGDTNMVLRIQQLGMYRARQWEVTMTDATDCIFLGAEEDFDVMAA